MRHTMLLALIPEKRIAQTGLSFPARSQVIETEHMAGCAQVAPTFVSFVSFVSQLRSYLAPA